jgi:murein DD-endopeptidase MepM/ murein hydrolase activator NlpD
MSGLMWFIAVLMIAMLAWVVSQRAGTAFSSTGDNHAEDNAAVTALNLPGETKADMPEFRPESSLVSISRDANTHTIIPEQSRDTITSYVVEAGDSVFSIGKKFNIKPETVLWANDNLNDNPNDPSVGQKLKIPAVDGVIYKWKKNDTIEGVARQFKTTTEEILTWPDNNLDLSNPTIAPGTMVMLPGGSRELRTWVVPTYWRANSGATRGINPGCDTSNGTAVGSGGFVWPTVSRLISGNDFWSGHLGIDIGAAMGSPVYASDSGVVVYAAGIGGGYGLMVMIDHGNGFHTLYAHLSNIIVRCGQNVSQGQTIAYSGSTGNSTGPHLHFEIRYMGAFVNPHDYVR